MAVSASNPFYIKPAVADFTPILQGLGAISKRKREEDKSVKNQAELMEAYSSGDPDAVASLLAKSPELSGALTAMLKHRDESTEKNYAESVAKIAVTTDPQQRADILAERIYQVDAAGGDSTESQAALAQLMSDPEGFEESLMLEVSRTQDKQFYEAYKSQRGTEGLEISEVQSSKILDNGTVVSVLKNNTTVVTDPAGTVLTGEDRAQAIRDAQEFGVDVQQRRAKGREFGKGAGKIALASFETVGKIRENILDLKRGIELIEKEGATTGYISDFLPNMKAATRKFANLRRKLGLNVVASVTFGALSEGELKLAMDVAMPKGMSEEQTVGWIKERIGAQEKYAANLEDAALYLADHSVAELIQRNRDMAKSAKKKESTKSAAALPPTNAKGWALKVDANGNKAYVSDTGEFEEVQ